MGPRVLVTHASRSVVLISNEVPSQQNRRSQRERKLLHLLCLFRFSLSSLKIQQQARACIFRVVNRARKKERKKEEDG